METNFMDSSLPKEPLVSIIVPVYNVEQYLQRCIDSIINQTYCNIEVILVNDGSPDNCGEICELNSKKDNRIQVIHQKNGGLSAARNSGLKASKGQYIAFIDSDDWIEKEMISTMVSTALKMKVKIVECDIRRSNEEKRTFTLDTVIVRETRDQALERLILNKGFSVCKRLYYYDTLKEHKFKVGRTSEDVYFTIDVFYDITAIAYIKFPFYNYFVEDSNSITRSTYNINILRNMIDSILYFQDRINHLNNAHLAILTKALVIKIAIYNYKSLFYHPYLDKDFTHRKKLKHLINKNFIYKYATRNSMIIKTLPIAIFKQMLALKIKIKGH